MYALYIYIETLVFYSIILVLNKIMTTLGGLGTVAEWYSTRKVHFWQTKKALKIVEEETEEQYKKFLDSMDKKEESK